MASKISHPGSIFSVNSIFGGESLEGNSSPVLFASFLNALESFLCDKRCNGVNFEFQYEDITLYLKLLALLYANNTVVFGTDEKEFQNNLDMFYEYLELWHFGTRQDQRFNINLGGHKIDICTDFKYLLVYKGLTLFT